MKMTENCLKSHESNGMWVGLQVRVLENEAKNTPSSGAKRKMTEQVSCR